MTECAFAATRDVAAEVFLSAPIQGRAHRLGLSSGRSQNCCSNLPCIKSGRTFRGQSYRKDGFSVAGSPAAQIAPVLLALEPCIVVDRGAIEKMLALSWTWSHQGTIAMPHA